MKSNSAFLGFVVGLGFGGAISWLITKLYYEEKNRQDIESVKETYSFWQNQTASMNLDDQESFDDEDEEAKDFVNVDYAKVIEQQGYKTDYNAISKPQEDIQQPTKIEEQVKQDKPYVIYPDEFGDYEDYNQISLVYYRDGVLADINDCIIDNIEETVGIDFADHIGEYEDDAVHIRNDSTKCDYEILVDLRSWEEVLESKPYLKTEE